MARMGRTGALASGLAPVPRQRTWPVDRPRGIICVPKFQHAGVERNRLSTIEHTLKVIASRKTHYFLV
ncbi:hypothetical protein M407DRAFT_208363 [Tulasnella calospora MUT 4182]|uniref:Uncharacterized protein n=1 Tax=Tulasnella calospora MUT 4182 TaxID=1051891 RepID=A0A0C3Q0S3_9AGAM|nr:hypothetical protein M407DRAFT_208363 [Tulasnella calospora MUT 4182]